MYGLKNIDIRIKDQQLNFIMVNEYKKFCKNIKEIIHFINLTFKNNELIFSFSNFIWYPIFKFFVSICYLLSYLIVYKDENWI